MLCALPEPNIFQIFEAYYKLPKILTKFTMKLAQFFVPSHRIFAKNIELPVDTAECRPETCWWKVEWWGRWWWSKKYILIISHSGYKIIWVGGKGIQWQAQTALCRHLCTCALSYRPKITILYMLDNSQLALLLPRRLETELVTWYNCGCLNQHLMVICFRCSALLAFCISQT